MYARAYTHIWQAIVAILVTITIEGCSKIENGPSVIKLRVTSLNTKGVAITNESINQTGQTFAINAYADDQYFDHTTGTQHEAGSYFEGIVATRLATKKWELATDQYWINGVNLRFWSYAPVETKGSRIINAPTKEAEQITVEYTMPASNGSTDADNQEDIIFAYNSETRNFDNGVVSGGTGTSPESTRATQYIDITFHHALSQILFAVSPDDDSFDINGLQIVDICIANISNSGTTTFNGTAFNWSGLSEKTSAFTQTLNAGFLNDKGAVTCPTGWSNSNYRDSQNNLHALYNYDNSFFLIPQTGAVLRVTFKRLADNTTITKSITLDDAWTAGYFYKYKLSAKTLNDNIVFSVSVTAWEAGGSASL